MEEFRVGLKAEVLKRADHENTVEFTVEFLPGLEVNLFGALAGQARKKLFDVFILVLADRQPDDVDVVLFSRPRQRRPPATADVEDRHPGFEIELAQYEVNLRHLGLFEVVVILFEVRAGVRQSRVEEQAEEIIRQVVVGLDILIRLL